MTNNQNKQNSVNQSNANNNAINQQIQGTDRAKGILDGFYSGNTNPTASIQNPQAPPTFGAGGGAGGNPAQGGMIGGQQIGNAPPPGTQQQPGGGGIPPALLQALLGLHGGQGGAMGAPKPPGVM